MLYGASSRYAQLCPARLIEGVEIVARQFPDHGRGDAFVIVTQHVADAATFRQGISGCRAFRSSGK